MSHFDKGGGELNGMKEKNSLYFIATVKKEKCWLLTAVLRGTEAIAFDRALDKEKSIFEFFVPRDMETVFKQVMAYLASEGVILFLEQKENRLAS